LREVDDRKGGTRPVTRLPYRFSQSACEPQRPAPTLGEHNAEVLGELLGLSKAHIDELERAGVLHS
jgi:CoA:oxalate CoA-transferase